jgi:hypothetical protein
MQYHPRSIFYFMANAILTEAVENEFPNGGSYGRECGSRLAAAGNFDRPDSSIPKRPVGNDIAGNGDRIAATEHPALTAVDIGGNRQRRSAHGSRQHEAPGRQASILPVTAT